MSFECGQQRVMRPGWERPGSLALRRVLTNRMREYFTYGSVGGAGGNPGSYPASPCNEGSSNLMKRFCRNRPLARTGVIMHRQTNKAILPSVIIPRFHCLPAGSIGQDSTWPRSLPTIFNAVRADPLKRIVWIWRG